MGTLDVGQVINQFFLTGSSYIATIDQNACLFIPVLTIFFTNITFISWYNEYCIFRKGPFLELEFFITNV